MKFYEKELEELDNSLKSQDYKKWNRSVLKNESFSYFKSFKKYEIAFLFYDWQKLTENTKIKEDGFSLQVEFLFNIPSDERQDFSISADTLNIEFFENFAKELYPIVLKNYKKIKA